MDKIEKSADAERLLPSRKQRCPKGMLSIHAIMKKYKI